MHSLQTLLLRHVIKLALTKDYLSETVGTDAPLPLNKLWSTLFTLLKPIWPTRTTLPSAPTEPLGDVWRCPSLGRSLDAAGKERTEGDDFVPFHKLSQWLCYSLVDAIESAGGWKVDRGQGQTGLPEVSWDVADLVSLATMQ